MTSWLNSHIGILNLFFSFVVAAAAVAYSVLTRTLVSETRTLRKVQTEPKLAINIESSELGLNFVNLVIRNVGQGAAHDLRLTLSKDIEWMKGKWLSQRGLFKHAVPYFGPGKSLETFLMSVLDHIKGGND